MNDLIIKNNSYKKFENKHEVKRPKKTYRPFNDRTLARNALLQQKTTLSLSTVPGNSFSYSTLKKRIHRLELKTLDIDLSEKIAYIYINRFFKNNPQLLKKEGANIVKASLSNLKFIAFCIAIKYLEDNALLYNVHFLSLIVNEVTPHNKKQMNAMEREFLRNVKWELNISAKDLEDMSSLPLFSHIYLKNFFKS